MKTNKTIVAQKSPKRNQKEEITIRATKAVKKDRLVYVVPECAERYLEALFDPFETPEGVCIPSLSFPIPSQKVRFFSRGTLALSTTGYGYIKFVPVTSSDFSTALVYTTSTSVGNANSNFSGGFTNTTSNGFPMAPYNSIQMGNNQVRSRIVAAGLRVKYIGALSESGGVAASMEEPDHGDLGPETFTTLNGNPYSSLRPIVPGPYWDKAVCYSGPVTPSDYEFSNSQTPLGTNAFMVIAISGPVGAQFEFEAYEHVEYIGSIIHGKTDGHAVPEAYSKIAQTVKSMTKQQNIEPVQLPTAWERFKGAVREGFPKLLEGGVTLVRSALELSPSKLYEGWRGIQEGINRASIAWGREAMSKALYSNQIPTQRLLM